MEGPYTTIHAGMSFFKPISEQFEAS